MKSTPGPSLRPHILLAGFPAAAARFLAASLEADARVTRTTNTEDALARFHEEEVTVFALGSQLAAEQARDLLHQVLEAHPASTTHNLVFAAGDDLSLFQELVDDGHISYLSAAPPNEDDIIRLLERMAHRPAVTAIPVADAFTRSLLAQARNLAASKSPGTASRMVAQTLRRTFDIDRAACRLYDPDSDTLWCEEASGEEARDSTAAGLTSYVVHTGAEVCLDNVGEDPRYDAEADNPGAPPNQRYLAVPLAGRDTPVVGALVLLRNATKPPFSNDERQQLRRGAHLLAGPLEQLLLEHRLNAVQSPIFRQQALEHHQDSAGRQGRVLALSPVWLDRVYSLLLAVFLFAMLYTIFARFHEYAAGPAAVRFEGLHEVTAHLSGSAVSVEVGAGETVRASQLLATFYDFQEATERNRLTHEFEASLLARLLAPNDPGTARTLGALRAQLDLAEARLEERSLRAPRDGVVSDLRLRSGQQVEPGQVVLTLTDATPSASIVALLPGHYRPQLRPGMALRLELHGYSYAYQHLEIERIDEEVLGPAEARRVLDPDIADALAPATPVVRVYARLPSGHFNSNGREYSYHPGMLATAEVRIRSERLLLVLVPALKALFGPRHGPVEDAR